MEFVITGEQLRKALADIEAAEANGFMHCLAVFRMASAGPNLDQCRAEYTDLSERAHPTSPCFNWGRFQGVTRRHRWVDGQLVKIEQSR